MTSPSPASPAPRRAPQPARARPSAGAKALRAVQPRAQATRDSLLAAGRHLLSTRDFDDVSIAELAAANSLSVGSFYGRFRDKEAFFAVLQRQVTAEWLQQADALLRQRAWRSAPRLVQALCRLAIDTFRRDAGFFRAALKHASTQPESWTPVKQAGLAVATRFESALAPLLTQLPPAERGLRIRFAVQALYGTGVNAVLNDPGPLHLADPALEREMARMMGLYLSLPTGTHRRSPKAPRASTLPTPHHAAHRAAPRGPTGDPA